MLNWLWLYPTTDEGAQVFFIVLAVCNFVLIIDTLLPYYEDNAYRTGLLALTHLGKMTGFLLAVAITGAHPRFSRVIVMPWSRRAWAFVAILLLLYVFSKTWTIFDTWYQRKYDHQ